ncbi:MAG: DUF268 domain-containing protein [Phycisphaeraceae bacterium]|nr:DUF268 domain-containing protein [Phycisphaeraceae bacterium]
MSNPLRPFARGMWRIYQPLRNSGRRFYRLPRLYSRFFRDWRQFKRMGGEARFELLAPCLFDQDPSTNSGGGHYFFQDVWALRTLGELQPPVHHDVGSRLDGFVGQVTAICPVVYWDIRPPSFSIPRFEYRKGSILELPLESQSIHSLSCLHVAEHIGLGRYGDPIDPEGTTKSLRELARVLAPGGTLLFAMPVGKEALWFNAQRIWDPRRPIDTVPDLKLVSFHCVTDEDKFIENTTPDSVANAWYACGMYRFTR